MTLSDYAFTLILTVLVGSTAVIGAATAAAFRADGATSNDGASPLDQEESTYHGASSRRRGGRWDALTGVLSRGSMRAAADSVLTEPARATRCALALIDIANFADINDTLGRGVGDQVLQRCAQRLAAVARPDDIVGRVGGDEFAVLMTDLPGRDIAEARANALIGAISVGIEHGKSRISMDARCGLAQAVSATTFDSLFANAEQALTAGKLFGGRVTSYSIPPAEPGHTRGGRR